MNAKVWVLYGSQKGNAKEIAKTLYESLLEKGKDCTFCSLNETVKKDSFSFLHL
jgi:menaquinone-dependent protoporphyrinogen IX oxidase